MKKERNIICGAHKSAIICGRDLTKCKKTNKCFLSVENCKVDDGLKYLMKPVYIRFIERKKLYFV